MPAQKYTPEQRAAAARTRAAKKEEKRAANRAAWAQREPANPAKLARRAVNRELWATSPNNTHTLWNEERKAARQAIPDIVIEASESSPSLARLRGIMADGDQPIYRRMDAADVIIDYELAPGAAANVPPDQLASTAFQFFRAVEANEKTPQALKFRALKAIARIENSRRSAAQSPEAHFANREFARRLCNAVRAQALREAGVWQQVVVSGARWALEPADQFELPVLPDYIGASIDKLGVAAYLDVANRAAGKEQCATERAQILLAVRASNRVDDWEQLLGGHHAEQDQVASQADGSRGARSEIR